MSGTASRQGEAVVFRVGVYHRVSAYRSIFAMRLIFHQPGHPQQPLHGIRYYLTIGAGLVVLGALYLLLAT